MSRLRSNNPINIIANSIELIQNSELNRTSDTFLTRSEAGDIVGIAPDTLNTLQEITDAIGNDPHFQTMDNNN